ncbi:Na/Pi symporter [Flammeovirga sp. MY04]|uniref:Na/Pi symporter n=1 Tax=Flammeovirga sp. MY04 TaxID=1191459 RepID=UPI0008063FC6|nr:Na/Pi symporter [Flammeovirga sp. MY04]ANQ51062.1 Na/Pi symporter [Flammeovirga sp. MY04]
MDSFKNIDIKSVLKKTLAMLVSFYLMFLAFGVMKYSFTLMGSEIAEDLVKVPHNPFIYFFIGLLGAAVFQSSSAVTTIVVGAVASGHMSLDDAVFIVMGANIGTTVTSTIVALSYIDDKSVFMRALSGAALHDFFNISVALIFLPLEIFTGFLSNLSQKLAGILFDQPTDLAVKNFNGFGFGLDGVVKYLFSNLTDYPWLIFFIAIVLIVGSLKLIGGVTKQALMENNSISTNSLIFKSDGGSLLSGTLITSIVQSSSITSSLIVPLTASKKISLEKGYMFIMGANVGTTITALFASITTGTEYGIEIALTHVLFNVLGVLIFLLIPGVKKFPIWYAKKLGFLAAKDRIFGFLYLFTLFFVLPFLLVWFSI